MREIRAVPASRQGLYRAVLGAEFDELAPVLQRFHGGTLGGRAHGQVRVERGRGPLARLAGRCIGAPAAGDDVSVDMVVIVEHDREVWTRRFAGAPMVTRQWRAGRHLVEALGPSALLFELERDGEALVFVQRGCRLLGIPLPQALSPRVRAGAGPSPDGDPEAWQIDVEIAAPVLGRIVAYSGIMRVTTPEPSAE